MRGKETRDVQEYGTIWWVTKKEQSEKGETKEFKQDRQEWPKFSPKIQSDHSSRQWWSSDNGSPQIV